MTLLDKLTDVDNWLAHSLDDDMLFDGRGVNIPEARQELSDLRFELSYLREANHFLMIALADIKRYQITPTGKD